MEIVHAVADVVLLLELAVVGFGNHSGGHACYGRSWIAVRLHVLQTGIASLPFPLQGPLKVNLGSQMPGFKGGESLDVASVRVPFLILVLNEGISFLLQLLGAHEAMLRSLEAEEAELFLQLSRAELLESGIGYAATTSRECLQCFLFLGTEGRR